MLKKVLLIILTVVLASACFTMTACKKTPTYTITFDTDGGTIVASQTVDEGAKVSKPSDPTKTGYEFEGWYLDGQEVSFDFDNLSVNSNMTIKAKWKVNQYSISFDTNGGNPSTIDTITQDYGTSVIAPIDPTKTGYAFLGWFEDGAENAYVFGTIEARDVCLTAKWEIGKYSIIFDSNGGSAVPTITKTYGEEAIEPANPTREGYTFVGWFESASIFTYTFDKIEARDVNLKAGWSVNEYSITFDLNGGEGDVQDITQDYGTAVLVPNAPTKTGYTFIGWFEEGASTAYSFSTIEARDLSLKAKWTANKYSIIFDSDGGSTIDTITKDFGSTVLAPTNPTRPGYNFLGWFEDGADNAYVFNTIEARNVTLKAKWGETEEHSITFDSDGGSTVATIIKRAGLPVVAPTNPTKTGYTFIGWFEDGSSTAYVFGTMESRNVLLKAKWEVNQYSITFNSNGGSAVATITDNYGEEVAKPSAPTRNGYVFLGWFEDGSLTPYEFDTIEARNVTLKAKWGEVRGVITLDKNMSGQLVIGFKESSLTPYVGQEIIIPDLECWGYKFLGWKNLNTNQMLEKVDGEYKIVHSGTNVTYQAQWQKISIDSDII